MEHQETNKEVINLVIARLRTIPSDAILSVGTNENDSFNATDLIEEVKNQTDIGKKIIEKQLFYLRHLKDLPIGERYA
ncbi:MAG: hypothetical protein V9E90_14100 [Saprospiraceae bacterium]|jgi:hypothetical protein